MGGRVYHFAKIKKIKLLEGLTDLKKQNKFSHAGGMLSVFPSEKSVLKD